MGKKYIIELKQGETAYKTVNSKGMPMIQLLAPIPYTEPDFKRAREVAYLEGLHDGQGVILESTQNNAFNNGYKKCLEDMEQIKKEAFEKGYSTAVAEQECAVRKAYEQGRKDGKIEGQSEMWVYVRKIACDRAHGGFDIDTKRHIFGSVDYAYILANYNASECIEKIRQYEQKEQFHIGDEFENGSGKRFVILKMDGAEIDRYIDEEGKTYCMSQKYEVMRKTGRHFCEIAEVLQKMKEAE